MTHIKPISALRNTTEISEFCHENAEPVFITRNGHGDLVIMSIETYDRELAISNIYRMLDEAETKMVNGEPMLSKKEFFDKIKEIGETKV